MNPTFAELLLQEKGFSQPEDMVQLASETKSFGDNSSPTPIDFRVRAMMLPMTRVQLISHPATPMPQVDSLDVALSPAGDGGLAVDFACHCYAGAMRLPDVRPAVAADELWRHTCCELFVGVAGDAAYREFNWSPSGQWAKYYFSDYRVRDSFRVNVTVPAPDIRFVSGAAGWTLQARLDAAALPSVAGEQIELSIAVVLEAADGNLSYWALRHAATRPDFHRRASFVLRLSDLA